MRRLLIALIAVTTLVVFVPATAQAAEPLPPVPPNFHWGVATSGYQSEGDAPPSNWSTYDDAKEPYLDSVDFRHRYPEDIANAASLGVDTFRFGIEWARVEPTPGKFDHTELAYYDDVIAKIRAHGMKPMITLSHWVHPKWFADQGGWASAKGYAQFLQYSKMIVDRYAGQDVTWITFNEPFIYLQRELTETKGLQQLLSNLQLPNKVVQAHNELYSYIHQHDPGSMVSSNVAYIPGAEPVLDAIFLDQMKTDFLGIDYYYGVALDNGTAVSALMGEFWKIDPAPEGLYYALKLYAQRFPGKPIWIIENGFVSDDGKPRADGYTRSDHLRDHVYWMQRAIAEGVPMIGFNYWTITDNYEWGSYRPRFGLWTVDAATDPTLTRRPTDGVATYTDVIEQNGNRPDYRPVRKPGLCNIDDLATSCLQRVLGLN